jgi:hypothetical protein
MPHCGQNIGFSFSAISRYDDYNPHVLMIAIAQMRIDVQAQ